MKTKTNAEKRPPTLAESLIVLLFFVAIIMVGYIGFHLKVEVLMVLSAIFAAFMARRCGYRWPELENAICKKIYQASPAILVMWSIGIVIAALMFSGSIPMVIYYGLALIRPEHLYFGTFLICAIMSVVTGTSWGSAGTIGIAMMGVAAGLNVSLSITAGAVISGSIFGDKLSPLSETTNLAPLCAGCNVYEHIGSMLYTTIPPTLLSAAVFWVAGTHLKIESDELPATAVSIMDGLSEMFRWSPLLLLPFAAILICALLKLPPVPTMIGSALLALVIGVVYQGFDLSQGTNAMINGFQISDVYAGEVSEDVVTLLNRGGMVGMVGIIVVLYCGYTYVGIISHVGFLARAIRPIMNHITNQVSLIGGTLLCDFFVMACSGSSYPAHIVTAEMFKKRYLDMGLEPKVLSRTLEDVGTMMAPLIPWGASGAFYITTLGVPMFGRDGFALWSVNTYTNPLMAMILAVTGIGMFRMSAEKKAAELQKYEQQNEEAQD